VGLDGDKIVADHLPEHGKVRNIRNDSRVALSIETSTRNAMGLTDTWSSAALPRITEGGAAWLLQRLARTYLGPDVRFPPMDSPPPGCGSLGRAPLTAACTGPARGGGAPWRLSNHCWRGRAGMIQG